MLYLAKHGFTEVLDEEQICVKQLWLVYAREELISLPCLVIQTEDQETNKTCAIM